MLLMVMNYDAVASLLIIIIIELIILDDVKRYWCQLYNVLVNCTQLISRVICDVG